MFDFIKSKLKNEDNKRLLINFLLLTILQILNYILPLITFPYLVRVIGVEKFGLVSFALATIAYFQIITDYGFNLSATREIAVHRDNLHKINEIFSSVMYIKFILLILCLISLTILIFSINKFREFWFIYYLTIGIVIGQILFPIWLFQGMEKMNYITLLNIIIKGFFTIFIFIFIRKGNDYWKIPLLNSISYIIVGLISIWLINNKLNIKFIKTDISVLFRYFKDSTQFFLSRVSVSIYTTSNTFVLGLLTNNIMVGYYSIAEKLYQALQYVYSPLIQTLYPYIANKKNVNLYKKIFKFIVFFNVTLIITLFFIAEFLFKLLFSRQTTIESINVFRIFLIASLFVIPSILLGYPLLAAMGYPEYPNKSVIYASIIHFIGLTVLFLFKEINIYSVSIMVIFTQLIDFLYRVYGVIKEKLWIRN